MKTLVIILLALVVATGSSFAQNLIAVQNAGTPKFFLKIDEAIKSAQVGDTIYLPGGSFGDCTINKRIHLVGVGHHPDSTYATNISLLGNIYFADGANGSTVSGIRTCYMQIGTNIEEGVSGLIISRCWIGSCSLLLNCPSNSFTENIIQLANGSGGTTKNNIFSNNIIGIADNFESCSFKNNIFLGAYSFCGSSGLGSSLNSISISTFENNYFASMVNVWNCIINNNISLVNINLSDNVGFNNLPNQAAGSVFVNQEGGAAFSYLNDYHLKSNCPGKNAGKDGTDIGIYGGAFPWKEGSLPFNPHYQRINISPTTDNNGNLYVNIKVAAQER